MTQNFSLDASFSLQQAVTFHQEESEIRGINLTTHPIPVIVPAPPQPPPRGHRVVTDHNGVDSVLGTCGSRVASSCHGGRAVASLQGIAISQLALSLLLLLFSGAGWTATFTTAVLYEDIALPRVWGNPLLRPPCDEASRLAFLVLFAPRNHSERRWFFLVC